MNDNIKQNKTNPKWTYIALLDQSMPSLTYLEGRSRRHLLLLESTVEGGGYGRRPFICLGAVDCIRHCQEGRDRCRLVHLKACANEVGRVPTESEGIRGGIRGGRDMSDGAGF